MRIVLCDDDEMFCRRFLDVLRDATPLVRYSRQAYTFDAVHSAEALYREVAAAPIDILFLDISMPGEDGFAIAQTLHEQGADPLLIFVSNFDSMVYYSLRFRPFRFIRKQYVETEGPEAYLAALEQCRKNDRRIEVRTNTETYFIRAADVIWFEKEKNTNYVLLHTADRMYRHRASVRQLTEEYRDFGFLEISRNLSVNPEFITSVKGNAVVLRDGEELMISGTRTSAEICAEYLKYMRVREE